MLISRNLHKKSSEVCIKTRSSPVSFSFKGLATKHTTVKCSIAVIINVAPQFLEKQNPEFIYPFFSAGNHLSLLTGHYVLWNLPFGRTFDKLGPISQSLKTFWAHFGWHNFLCIFKTKASRITKLYSYFNFPPLCNTWKDQLYRINRSEFYEWVFGPEKSSGLSRNANPWTGHNLLPGNWQHLEEDNSRCAGEMFGHRVRS